MILTPAPPSPREKSCSQLPVAQSSRCGVWGRRAQSALDSAGSGRPGRRGRSLSCPRHRQGTRFPAGERPPFALLCGAPRRPRLRRADSWRGTDAEWRGDGPRRRLDGAQPHLGAWAWGLQEAVLQDARSSFRRTEWHLRRWRARVAVTRGDCAPSVTLMELVRDANSPLRLNEGESVLTFLSEWRAGVDIERVSEKRKTECAARELRTSQSHARAAWSPRLGTKRVFIRICWWSVLPSVCKGRTPARRSEGSAQPSAAFPAAALCPLHLAGSPSGFLPKP